MLGSNPDWSLGKAEFTKDMVETMLQHFNAYADDQDVVTVRVRSDGLWLQHPVTGTWQFLGLARLPKHLVQ